MKHYKTLMRALAGAMPICMTWKLAGTDEGMNARDIYAPALEEGGDNEELPEEDFYVVSSEGAIGLSTRYEYLTRWIFIPLTGEEKEKEMERLRAELAFDRETEAQEAAAAAQEAAAKAQGPTEKPNGAAGQANAAAAQANTAAGQPNMAAGQPAMPRFCANCGKPLNPGAKFCRNCGSPV